MATDRQRLFGILRQVGTILAPVVANGQTTNQEQSMKKLTKTQIDERAKWATALVDAYGTLEEELQRYNDTMEDAWRRLSGHIDTYNGRVDEVNDWKSRIANDIQEEIDSHQEKWQDTERGQRYIAWQQAYESEDLEAVTWLRPCTPLDMDIGDQADLLGALPDTPG